MAIANDQKRTIPPTHPGAMLREDFLPDYALTADSLANELGESRHTIRELLQEQCAVSSIMALKLSRLFENSPEFWLRAQHARDTWELEQQYRDQSVRDSHNKAMDFAERAFVERIQGRREQAHNFFIQALEYELAAIAQLEVEGRIEPTYSVLHRSAGTLALDCNQPKKADEIVKKALNQNPPQEIAEELHELLHRISLLLSPRSLRRHWIDKNVWTDSNSSTSVRTFKEVA